VHAYRGASDGRQERDAVIISVVVAVFVQFPISSFVERGVRCVRVNQVLIYPSLPRQRGSRRVQGPKPELGMMPSLSLDVVPCGPEEGTKFGDPEPVMRLGST
jgi:hypothetical protein